MTTTFKAFALTSLFAINTMFALTDEQKKREEYLSADNIARFEKEICHLLKKEEDIQTCAEVHKFFAQVLKNQKEVTNGQKTTAALSAPIGACIGAILGMVTQKFNRNDLSNGLIAGFIGGIFGGFTGSCYLMNPKNAHNPEEMDAFIKYFQELAINPTINKPGDVHNATQIAQLHERTEKEKAFNKLVHENELLEKAPEFERYRSIRKSKIPAKKATEPSAPKNIVQETLVKKTK